MKTLFFPRKSINLDFDKQVLLYADPVTNINHQANFKAIKVISCYSQRLNNRKSHDIDINSTNISTELNNSSSLNSNIINYSNEIDIDDGILIDLFVSDADLTLKLKLEDSNQLKCFLTDIGQKEDSLYNVIILYVYLSYI